jgi:succinate dehydrogenase / fumarate reductase iron-sulfur subunit
LRVRWSNSLSPRTRRSSRGKHWPKPAGSKKVKTFKVYRYDPGSGRQSALDTYYVDMDDCGPMVLDALIWIKNKIDPTLAFRRSCREGVSAARAR